jgi:hypothetical protein
MNFDTKQLENNVYVLSKIIFKNILRKFIINLLVLYTVDTFFNILPRAFAAGIYEFQSEQVQKKESH